MLDWRDLEGSPNTQGSWSDLEAAPTAAGPKGSSNNARPCLKSVSFFLPAHLARINRRTRQMPLAMDSFGA